jgi:hypothetical protein
MFRFKCSTCDEWHEGVPHLSAEAPPYYYAVPEAERRTRCELSSDICVVDREFFFVRGVIEIPVDGLDEAFGWGVWVSLSEASFREYLVHYEDDRRSALGPYFGWLSAAITGYPDTENLKTMVHPRKPDLRPLIELEPTEHPLAVEQRQGIDRGRLAEIYETALHPE